MTVVGSQRGAVLSDDRPGVHAKALALEERAVVVATQETGLLALAPSRRSQPGVQRLDTRLRLRLLAERKPHMPEQRRIDGREHVGLILDLVGRTRDEAEPVALDDAGVVTRPQLVCAGTPCKCHELVESKRPVAAHARIRRLPRVVRMREWIDDRVLELLAQVERHVREPALVTRGPRRCDRGRRAARALGVGRSRVLPEPERHPDRVRPGADERDGTVDPAAHRDGNAPGTRCRRERRAKCGRECLDRERIAVDCGRLDERQSFERTIEPGRIRSDDRVVVDLQPDGGPCIATRRVSEGFVGHRTRLATDSRSDPVAKRPASGISARPESRREPVSGLAQGNKVLHPADESTAVANLASQVGAVRSVGNAYLRLRLPLRVCWFT